MMRLVSHGKKGFTLNTTLIANRNFNKFFAYCWRDKIALLNHIAEQTLF